MRNTNKMFQTKANCRTEYGLCMCLYAANRKNTLVLSGSCGRLNSVYFVLTV